MLTFVNLCSMFCNNSNFFSFVPFVQPVYGISSKEGYIPFRHASGGGREIYFTEEKELDLHNILGDSTPKIPVDVSLKGIIQSLSFVFNQFIDMF